MTRRIAPSNWAIKRSFLSDVWKLTTSTTKIMKTHYWYRSRFEENFSKFFRNFRGKFFGQNFFFTFSTFQVKIHTLTKKKSKKKILLFWRQTKLTSDKNWRLISQIDGAIFLVNSTYRFQKSIHAYYVKTCQQRPPIIKNHT